LEASYPYTLHVNEFSDTADITIRPAFSEDAEGIARTFLESAEYHAQVDPERYSAPAFEAISAHYRQALRDVPQTDVNITFVATLGNEIVGFIEARLEQSPDAMHRETLYCHVAEMAVLHTYQNQGIGRQLLRAAEGWGRQKGAVFASLEYHASNTPAAAFYRQLMGYRVAAITAIKRL